ncbi:MAG: ankyrin repeat domain-containing protein [Nitrospirota bacterium]
MRMQAFAFALVLSACTSGYLPSDPFLNAARNGQTNKVTRYLDQGVDINLRGEYGETALMFAASHGRLDTVRALLSKGADVNAKNQNGGTALMGACSSRFFSAAVVSELLDNGADINARASDGVTALMLAVLANRLDAAELLIARGAHVNLKADNGAKD